MAQPEPIVVDEPAPAEEALEGRSGRLAVVFDDGTVVELSDRAMDLLRHSFYVSLEHAAVLIGAPPFAVEELIQQGKLEALARGDESYLSLRSVLDYERAQRQERGEALDEMIRVSEEGGLYEAELDLL